MSKSKHHKKAHPSKKAKARPKKQGDRLPEPLESAAFSPSVTGSMPDTSAQVNKRKDLVFAGNVMVVLFSLLFIMISQSTLGKYYAGRYAAVEAELSSSELIANAKNTSFSVKLNYHYLYLGHSYQGTHSIYSVQGQSFNRREQAQSYLKRYTKQQKLTIYVNPQKPEQSVFSNQGPQTGDYLACLFVGFLWALGWLVSWFGLHPDKLPRKKALI